MKIEARDFGILDIEENNIAISKQLLLGFEEYTRCVLVNDSNMDNGICRLQSIEQKNVCLIMLNPLGVRQDYASVVMQDMLTLLQVVSEDNLDRWVFMVIGETFQDSTVNLKSPVIINHETNLDVQVILDQDYPIRQPIFSQGERDGLC